MQQRPQTDVELDLPGLEHVVRLAPVGIRQFDVLQVYVGSPAPVDRDFSDLRLAARDGAGVIFNLCAQVIG